MKEINVQELYNTELCNECPAITCINYKKGRVFFGKATRLVNQPIGDCPLFRDSGTDWKDEVKIKP